MNQPIFKSSRVPSSPAPVEPSAQSHINPGLPGNLVGRILTAASIAPDPAAPLAWFRLEHETDACRLLSMASGDENKLIAALREITIPPGQKEDQRVQSLQALFTPVARYLKAHT